MTYTLFDAQKSMVICQGDWIVQTLSSLLHELSFLKLPPKKAVCIDTREINVMDISGAMAFFDWTSALVKQGIPISIEGMRTPHQQLVELVKKERASQKPVLERKTPSWIARFGEHTVRQALEAKSFIDFVGETTVLTSINFFRLGKLHFRSLVSTLECTGFQALAIIALLSFMVGVVLTYQMGLQLRNYGADIYIADLLGLAILREFGPLLTAIMVAGRTGSAFTAQLAIMVLNQEIDALKTMGLSPNVLLITPRIIGLVIVLPLLTMWSNLFGLLGGIEMSHLMLDIAPNVFLTRFREAITLTSLWIGLGKAPVFALIIASIGCFQGMTVRGGATGVGINTTKSVVQAIFFIIVADAIFSVIFSKLGI